MPEGAIRTITFLLTDIEGSTKLWENNPERMPLVLTRHDALATELIAQNRGMLVKSRGEGDSLFCVFDQAEDAIAAALAMQRAFVSEEWPDPIQIRVRMAIHTGEAHLREGDYYGSTVNRCARLRAVAHGGQIVLSGATQEVIGTVLPEQASLSDLGQHRLKDLQQPEHIWQVLHPELPSEFPPLLSLNAAQHNLPQQTTSFIGRSAEIDSLRQQLKTARLLTLAGIGGTGKTRLALQLGAEMLGQFTDGVWFVELAAISDETLVAQAVATALQIQEEPGSPLLDTLTDKLRNKQVLIIQDNCEHLISACARLISTLLRNCPGLRVIATSREALSVQGETLFRIAALSLPDPNNLPGVDKLLEYEAVRLFVERAGAVSQSFELNEQNAVSVAQICGRLDGIPLAIELAAARVRVLPVEQIASRLDDCFRLLTGGSRTGLAHHQTLRAAIDWSYQLLTDTERSLLARLSVFAGGWPLEAAESICPGEGLEDWEVLDVLASLVDKSLVLYEQTLDRYRLLETVRQYSREKLQALNEEEKTGQRHAEHFLAKAQEWNVLLENFGEAERAMEAMTRDVDNLRAGMDWSDMKHEEPLLVDYALSLARFFLAKGLYYEGDHRLETAVEAARHLSNLRGLAQLLLQRGRIAWLRSDLPGSRRFWSESYEINKQLGDQPRLVPVLINLGNVAWAESDFDSARQQYDLALELARETKQPRYEAFLLGNLGLLASDQGDFEIAARYCAEGLAMHRRNNNERGYADTLLTLADIARRQQQFPQAEKHLAESREKFQTLGLQHEMALTLVRLGELLVEQSRFEEAEAHITEGMRIAKEIGDFWTEMPGLIMQARLLGMRGKVAEAGELYRRSLAISQKQNVGGRKHVADILRHVGYTLRDNGQAEVAIRALRPAYRAFCAMGLWDRFEIECALQKLTDTPDTDTADDAEATLKVAEEILFAL